MLYSSHFKWGQRLFKRYWVYWTKNKIQNSTVISNPKCRKQNSAPLPSLKMTLKVIIICSLRCIGTSNTHYHVLTALSHTSDLLLSPDNTFWKFQLSHKNQRGIRASHFQTPCSQTAKSPPSLFRGIFIAYKKHQNS